VRLYGHPAPPDRRRRIEVFARAYGLESGETLVDGLADEVVAQQEAVLERVRALAGQGLQPQADWVAGGITAQLRARIAWSRAQRQRYSRRNVAP
jgi:hypothetical protein